ncbi:MAG: SDR family oxidoreductase [Chloroflexota bacterium]|nr:SDR family oxidoreductase [Chloroflexota bacterium]
MSAQSLAQRYPGYALITGASSGIGKAFAQHLAKDGVQLVLVARREALLTELAAQLRAAHKVDVHIIAIDLTQPDAADQIKAYTDQQHLNVSMVVNNAGYGDFSLFHEADRQKQIRMVDLNCRAPVALTSAYVPEMVARKNGAVIFVGSTVSYQPVPLFATYSATKGFDLYFGEALWGELKPHHVDVITVCPGATDTEFMQVANVSANAGNWQAVRPEPVVAETLRKLGQTPSFVYGKMNALVAQLYRFLPRRSVVQLAQRFAEG